MENIINPKYNFGKLAPLNVSFTKLAISSSCLQCTYRQLLLDYFNNESNLQTQRFSGKLQVGPFHFFKYIRRFVYSQ